MWKVNNEDGIQLPFTYIGSGHMEYIEGSKKDNGHICSGRRWRRRCWRICVLILGCQGEADIGLVDTKVVGMH